MNKKINSIKLEIENFKIENKKDLEIFRIEYVSKKNKISKIFNEIKNLETKEKKKVGHILNEIKEYVKKKFKNKKKEINKNEEIINKKFEDLTLPPGNKEIGSLHPITIIRYKIVSIFKKIGFTIIDGPEIEND
jgi:phenylalanyl-tRNA synthetase alpha chain|tara:strand:- start:936 stop:1337 length:402 start_codon:yes stop_codon:yes gene_type:complete